jgi:single-strand DNA-binding protein
MNSVNIIGRLGKDPELKYTPSGIAICTVSIAVNEGKTKEGEKKPPSWFDVVCLDKIAENIAQYCGQGDEVAVSGRLHQNKWETEEGEKRSRVEIVANRVDFGRKKGEGSGGNGNKADEQRAQEYDRAPREQTPAPAPADEMDAEDPFDDQ